MPQPKGLFATAPEQTDKEGNDIPFSGRKAIKFIDAGKNQFYVRSDLYEDGKLVSPQHLVEEADGRLVWVDGDKAKPVRWEVIRKLLNA